MLFNGMASVVECAAQRPSRRLESVELIVKFDKCDRGQYKLLTGCVRWSAISKNNFGSDSREVKRDLVKRRDTPGHKNTFLIVGPHELHEGSRQGACEGHNRESSVPLFQQARRPEENTHFIVGEY
ncbi:hypothetical protein MRX96_024803 [Rhipicephalus microplus]